MIWISAIFKGIVDAIIAAFKDDIGKTKATDAKHDTKLLTNAGFRIRSWMRARNVSNGGKPDEGGPKL